MAGEEGARTDGHTRPFIFQIFMFVPLAGQQFSFPKTENPEYFKQVLVRKRKMLPVSEISISNHITNSWEQKQQGIDAKAGLLIKGMG